MHSFNKINVLITVPCCSDIRTRLASRFDIQCQFTFLESGQNIPEPLLHSADVIIGEPDEADILKTTQLKWLQLTWAGADKYTRMKHLSEHLTITNASGAFGIIISEYVVGAIIALYRSFPQYGQNQRHHLWQKDVSSDTICGKTVLILGTGDIGTRLAHRLKAFDTHIIGLRRNPIASVLPDFDEVHGLCQLDDMLKKADIVVGCLPHTPETAGLLDERRLHLMKKDALLINVGRGSLIKNNDLIHVLKSGRLKGVVLDVSEIEPMPTDSQLWDMPNVFVTPHIAGPSFGGNSDVENTIWNICIQNLERFLNSEPLEHVVNLKDGY